jgi:serine/alanine adding enzyme
MSNIKISVLGQDTNRWQDYVRNASAASFYHSLEWRDIIEQTFGHRPYYLLAERGDKICGVLPLVEMRSWLFGHFLVSLPFFNYGGILADDPEVERELALAAVVSANRTGAAYIELRQSASLQGQLEGWILRQHKAALVLRLEGNAKSHWDGLSSRLRGKVRKAEKNSAMFTSGGLESLQEFYHLYALNMRNLGTPVYSRALFANIFKHLGDRAHILMVRRRLHPAAAAVAIHHGSRIEMPWICQDYTETPFNVNEFLYWRAIEWACSRNVAELDFGRSTIDSGPYCFKQQWNPEVRVLSWYCWSAPGVPLPQLNPDNRKFALAIRGWKKLPLAIANRIGPFIVRNLP